MGVIIGFWHEHEVEQGQITKLICALLNMLHNTRLMGDVFAACFFT
jgi:hypothetical protein